MDLLAGALEEGGFKILLAPLNVATKHLQLPIVSPVESAWLPGATIEISQRYGLKQFRGPMFGILSTVLTKPVKWAIPILTYNGLHYSGLFRVLGGGSFGRVFSGAMAGIITSVLIFPAHVVENCLTMDLECTQYRGAIDCMYQLLKHGGVSRFYSGFSVAPVGILLYRGLYFSLYDGLNRSLFTEQDKSSILGKFALGYGVTIVSGLVCYPLDVTSRLMSVTGFSAMKAVSSIYNEHGLSGFFKGAGNNIVNGIIVALIPAALDRMRKQDVEHQHQQHQRQQQ